MKKILIVLTVVLLTVGMAITVFGQQWHVTNQATVAWDAPATLSDGSAIPEGNVIRYDVFVANAVTDPDKENPVTIATNIDQTEYTLTLNTEGKYFIGLEAIRIVDGSEVSRSTRIWSDDVDVCQNGEAFGIQHFVGLGDFGGMIMK